MTKLDGESGGRMRTRTLYASAFMLLASLAVGLLSSVGGAASAARPATPYVTFLFSRTAVSAADDCVRDDRGVATLERTVARYMARLGMRATGTIETGRTRESTLFCTHYRETLATSWDKAATLARVYGWTFASHSATYAMNWSALSPDQIWAQTCGSAATIARHSLPGGHGLFAWPSNKYDDTIQRDYVSTCFAFGRQYSSVPTTRAYATTPPYYQHTDGMSGGACNDPSLRCYTASVQNQFHRYELPSKAIKRLSSLQPGQWHTFQVYLLVRGTNPPYATNPNRWDCTSSHPRRHWTNDNERYCWKDFRRILAKVPSNVIVTDPLTVAHAFGRTGY